MALIKRIIAKITGADLIKEAEEKPLTVDEQLEKILNKPAPEEKGGEK